MESIGNSTGLVVMWGTIGNICRVYLTSNFIIRPPELITAILNRSGHLISTFCSLPLQASVHNAGEDTAHHISEEGKLGIPPIHPVFQGERYIIQGLVHHIAFCIHVSQLFICILAGTGGTAIHKNRIGFQGKSQLQYTETTGGGSISRQHHIAQIKILGGLVFSGFVNEHLTLGVFLINLISEQVHILHTAEVPAASLNSFVRLLGLGTGSSGGRHIQD